MTDNDLTLYFFPGSYYSHKALLTLYEKGVPFKERVVYIHHNEQNEEWYLRKVNPKGAVPVLQAGQHFITESEDIVDYVDSRYKSGPTLVPDVGTELGQEVKRFRKLLDGIPIDLITFGVLANRKFCTKEISIPKMFNKEKIAQTLSDNICNLQKLRKNNPDMAAEFDTKIKAMTYRREVVLDEEKVANTLRDLEKHFNEIETRLEKTKRETSSNEYWLLGNNITAADVTATIFMFRLNFLGVLGRFTSETKRPMVFEYYRRLLARPAVKQLETINATWKSLEIKQTLKLKAIKAVKIVLVVGVVVLGFLGFREYFDAKRGLQRTH